MSKTGIIESAYKPKDPEDFQINNIVPELLLSMTSPKQDLFDLLLKSLCYLFDLP